MEAFSPWTVHLLSATGQSAKRANTHTHTRALIKTDQSLGPSAEKGQQKQFMLDCLPLLLKRISMTFTKDCVGQKQSGGQIAMVWDKVTGTKLAGLQAETKPTCVAPWEANAGHVFNQRKQNAFIKPITGKSCGAEPHSHSHYSSSGDSHLHLAWCYSSHPLFNLCLCHLLFHSFAQPEIAEATFS